MAGDHAGRASARPTAAAGAPDLDLGPLLDVAADHVVDRVVEALAEILDERESRPALLDRRGIARALGCSLDVIDRLRRDGLPEIRLVEASRFELEAVLEWLRGRSGSDG